MARVAVVLVLAVTLALLANPQQPASAQAQATFTVNSTVDAVDASPGDGVCETAPGNQVCTLRAATMEANAKGGTSTLSLPPGVYETTIPGKFEDGGLSGDIDIRSNITIAGSGQTSTFVQGGPDANSGVDRVFDVLPGASLTIRNITIRYGRDETNFDTGAGIRAAGSVVVEMSQIRENFARTGGGGIYTTSTLEIKSTKIEGNSSEYNGGGGIYSSGGSPTLIEDSWIQNNSTTLGYGGGMYVSGDVDIIRSIVSGNSAKLLGGRIEQASFSHSMNVSDSIIENNSAERGGGIRGGGTVTILRSTIAGNIAITSGGGIDAFNRLQINQSTVSDNLVTSGKGGGIYGAVSINNSTVSSNTALAGNSQGGEGGGIYFEAASSTATWLNATIAQNAAVRGDGLYKGSGVLQIQNSIVSSDSGPSDCYLISPVVSLGHNIESGNGCNFSAAGDQVATSPLLGPLLDNGGSTRTHALRVGSSAIDAGLSNNCLSEDQRGYPRPQDGDGIGGAICDIGAFEAGLSTAIGTPTSTSAPAVTQTPTITPSLAATVTSTPTNTATETLSPQPTLTLAPTHTNTVEATLTPSPTSSLTPQVGVPATATSTITPSNQATATFSPTVTALPTVMSSTNPPSISVSQVKAGPNRLLVTLTARSGQAIQRADWSLPSNATAEGLDGAPLPTGLTVPPSVQASAVSFYLRRTGDGSVTLPITVTGSFGTWRTFVGGGPNAF